MLQKVHISYRWMDRSISLSNQSQSSSLYIYNHSIYGDISTCSTTSWHNKDPHYQMRRELPVAMKHVSICDGVTTNIQSQPSLLTLFEHKTSFSLQVISSECKQAMRKQFYLYAWGTNAAAGAKGMLSMLRQQQYELHKQTFPMKTSLKVLSIPPRNHPFVI